MATAGDLEPDLGFESDCARLVTLAFRMAYPVVGQRETAQDIAQETVARAYVRWSRISDHSAAWVSRVALNLALDHVKRKHPALAPTRPQEPDPFLAERLDLQRVLRALPKRQREAVVMRYVLDLSEAQIAELLEIRPGTVKTHLARGLAQLRNSMGERP